MVNFILGIDVHVSEAGNKNKQDARETLEASEQHEEQTDSKVSQWRKNHSRRFRRKKRKKGQDVFEVVKKRCFSPTTEI